MLRFLSFSFPWPDKFLYKGKIGFKSGIVNKDIL